MATFRIDTLDVGNSGLVEASVETVCKESVAPTTGIA
jgi:hypothetical protein